MPWPLSGPVNPYSQFVSPGVMVQTPKQGETVAPVSAFAPSDLTGLAGWWKADAITGLIDGDPVGTWVDSSGNGRNATQGTAANKPTYRTNVVNGKPVVRFDGVDDFLSFTALSVTQHTLFAVLKQTGDSGIVGGTGPNPQTRIGLTANKLAFLDHTTVSESTTLAVTQGNWMLVEFVISAAAVAFFQNGTAFGTGSYDGTSLDYARIGSLGSGNRLNGDMAEAVMYSRALSTSERQQVETHLMSKYAIV